MSIFSNTQRREIPLRYGRNLYMFTSCLVAGIMAHAYVRVKLLRGATGVYVLVDIQAKETIRRPSL